MLSANIVMLHCSGYMAPEYAMRGRFSEKSDVFSFGVLVLEIISGKRNTSFYNDELSLGLLGYVSWFKYVQNSLVSYSFFTLSQFRPCLS